MENLNTFHVKPDEAVVARRSLTLAASYKRSESTQCDGV